MATKTYQQMTPAERLADRIAKNKVIDAKVAAQRQFSAVRQERRTGKMVVEFVNSLVEIGDVETAVGVADIYNQYHGNSKIVIRNK